MIPIFEARASSKKYLYQNKEFIALEETFLSIYAQDLYGIIGQSGAGKSTLLRLLAGLIQPTTGTIFFETHDLNQISKLDKRLFYQKIGMIFQHFHLLNARTVAENIAYPLEIARVPLAEQKLRIVELLDLVGLKHKAHSYPCQLSGGEKQRVGIARALANHPKVLLCDEATSALDPTTTEEILDLLKKVNKELGVTIVLITHEMEVIKRICNKVAVMDKGKIIEEGSVVQVFSDPKEKMTKRLLDSSTHAIPQECFHNLSATHKLVRLKFKGDSANQPVISDMIRHCRVETNILMGWLDRLEGSTVGTLVITLTGEAKEIELALQYLETKFVHYEVVENE